MGTVGRLAFHKLAAYSFLNGNQALENMYSIFYPETLVRSSQLHGVASQKLKLLFNQIFNLRRYKNFRQYSSTK
jgi:hypothetical protein